MFVRALFTLLLALNLGGAAWLLFAQRPAQAPAAVADLGVPALVLLSEREGEGVAATAELASAPESGAELASDECRTIGPFATQSDTRAALNALAPLPRQAFLLVAVEGFDEAEAAGRWAEGSYDDTDPDNLPAH